MKKRILAQLYRAAISMTRDGFRFMDITFWPLVLYFSMTLFAFSITDNKEVIGLITVGALGWRLLYHFQIESAQIFMDQYWNNSVEHLMISPLRRSEFVLSGVLIGLIKGTITGSLFLILSKVIFGFSITHWGPFLLGALCVAISGVILGIISLGITYLKGVDAFAFVFAFPDMLAVLSGVFYPITLFPIWLQKIVVLFPSTHAFSLLKGQGSLFYFVISTAVWLTVAWMFNTWAFEKARREGKLVKLK